MSGIGFGPPQGFGGGGLSASANETITGDWEFTGTVTFSGTVTSDVAIRATTVGVEDSDASHHMDIACGSNLTANRILTISPGDAARTLTLSGNPTLADWFDQSVKQASSPTFAGLTLTGALLFSADNTHDIGASGANRPRNVYAGTSVNTPALDGGAGNIVLKAASNSRAAVFQLGLMTASNSGYNFSSTSDPLGARDAGLFRNAPGVVEVNNGTAGTFRDLRVRALLQSGANGQAATVQQATDSQTVASGATFSFSNLIPAGAMVVGVTIRVTTAITSGDGGSSFAIGDGSDVDRWGTGIAFAGDTTTDGSDFTITTVPFYAAATSVVLTVDSGTFSGTGVVRCTVHYVSLTAATS